MKRIFSTQNLIELTIALMLAVMAATVACAQDNPPKPEPQPAAKIVGPEFVPAGKKVRVKVDGGPVDAVYVWNVTPLDSADMDEGEAWMNFSALNSKAPYVVQCWVVVGKTKTELARFQVMIGDKPTPPPPDPIVVVPTLRTLAGDKAAPLSAMYAALLEALGKEIDTVELFKSTEALTLESRRLTGHGATAEIAKRLNVKTVEELKVAVAKVVSELGASPGPTEPATAATYVYEKDNGTPSPAVMSGLNRLNREKKIRATIFEQDTKDGDGDVPDQYKVALSEAKKSGLPALVVTNGERVIKVVKDPRTEEDVFGVAP